MNPGVDTLARWMAHYIAEQIAIAENATGNDKVVAEQRCFETIFKIWQHRSSLPNGCRPFESFEPILRALEKLDPQSSVPYYYSLSDDRSLVDNNSENTETRQFLEMANVIDRAARTCLQYVFSQAANSAKDEKTIKWIEKANATISPSRDDIEIVVRLIHAEAKDGGEATERERQAKQNDLESRIEYLDAFMKCSQILHSEFVNELEAIKRDSTFSDATDLDL